MTVQLVVVYCFPFNTLEDCASYSASCCASVPFIVLDGFSEGSPTRCNRPFPIRLINGHNGIVVFYRRRDHPSSGSSRTAGRSGWSRAAGRETWEETDVEHRSSCPDRSGAAQALGGPEEGCKGGVMQGAFHHSPGHPRTGFPRRLFRQTEVPSDLPSGLVSSESRAIVGIPM